MISNFGLLQTSVGQLCSILEESFNPFTILHDACGARGFQRRVFFFNAPPLWFSGACPGPLVNLKFSPETSTWLQNSYLLWYGAFNMTESQYELRFYDKGRMKHPAPALVIRTTLPGLSENQYQPLLTSLLDTFPGPRAFVVTFTGVPPPPLKSLRCFCVYLPELEINPESRTAWWTRGETMPVKNKGEITPWIADKAQRGAIFPFLWFMFSVLHASV